MWNLWKYSWISMWNLWKYSWISMWNLWKFSCIIQAVALNAALPEWKKEIWVNVQNRKKLYKTVRNCIKLYKTIGFRTFYTKNFTVILHFYTFFHIFIYLKNKKILPGKYIKLLKIKYKLNILYFTSLYIFLRFLIYFSIFSYVWFLILEN